MAELLDYDPLTGESVTFDYNADGSYVIGHHAQISHILDHNAKVLAEADHKKQLKESWVHYASGITNAVILHWRQKYGVDFFNEDHWPAVMKLLNSREYRGLKTTPLSHDR